MVEIEDRIWPGYKSLLVQQFYNIKRRNAFIKKRTKKKNHGKSIVKTQKLRNLFTSGATSKMF